MFNNPGVSEYEEAEFYHYDKEYGIGQFKEELSLCVVASGRNLYSRNIYQEFILSMDRQNYTNFHVVVLDDASTDSTMQGMYAFIDAYTPRLKSRFTLVVNEHKTGAFTNRDSGIK